MKAIPRTLAIAATAAVAGACALVLNLEDKVGVEATDAGPVLDAAPAPDGGGASDAAPIADAAAGVDGSELVAMGSTPRGIAVDGTSVYWANEGAGTVVRRAKADGASVIVIAAEIPGARAVAVDAVYAYWAATNTPVRRDDAGTPLFSHVVGRTPKDKAPDAGTLNITTYFDSNQELARTLSVFEGYDRVDGGVAVADNYVFWSNEPLVYGSRRDSVSLTQQNTATPPDSSKGPGLVKTDDQNAYFITRDNTTLWRQPKTSTAPGVLFAPPPVMVDNVGAVVDWAVDDVSFYFLLDTGAVLRRKKAGGAGVPKETVALGGLFPQQLVADEKYLYWTRGAQEDASADGQVLATPKDGSNATPIVLASGLRRPFGLAVDPKLASPPRYVYYTTVGDGAIRRTHAP